MIRGILIGLFILLGVYLTLNFLTINSGFGYELTKNDTIEGVILQICIDGQIKLDYCNNLYGGGIYGDVVK